MAVDGPKPIALRPEEAALVQPFILLENLLLAGLILRVISDQLSEYYRKPLESKYSKAAATNQARKEPRVQGAEFPPDSLIWTQHPNLTYKYRDPPPSRSCRPRPLPTSRRPRLGPTWPDREWPGTPRAGRGSRLS